MSARAIVVALVCLSTCFALGQTKSGTKGGAKPPTKPKTAPAKPKTPPPTPAQPEKPGPLIYPEGRWKGLNVYNTPFEGIDGDFSATSAMVLKVRDLTGIDAGSKITHYRVTEEGDYVAATDWKTLLQAVKDGDGDHLWVKGITRSKKPFETSLTIISDDMWTAPDLAGDLEGLIPGVTLKEEDQEIVVAFAKTDAALKVGSVIVGAYPADSQEPKAMDDLRAFANFALESGRDKMDVAVRIAQGVSSKISVSIDPAAAKRWLGVEAPDAPPIATCLAEVFGTPGAVAKVAAVTSTISLKPGDVITGVRAAGGTAFAKVTTWQDLQDFIAAIGKPKTVDLRVLRTSNLVDTVAAVPTR